MLGPLRRIREAAIMTETLLPTTVVGSYPQPDWLIDRDRLTHQGPVRVRAQELWRVPEPWLEAAQDDATRLAIGDMERAGIDIITDGEIRRESYSNRFATALAGIDLDNPAEVGGRTSGTGPRLRHEIHPARSRLRQAHGIGRGCGDRAPRADRVLADQIMCQPLLVSVNAPR